MIPYFGFLPARVAYADLNSFLTNVNDLIITPIIELLFALAIAYFLYGLFKFLANQDKEEKKTEGKEHMLWGIIGITIMLGVWFFLGVIVRTLGIDGDIDPEQNRVELPEYNGGPLVP